MDEAAAINRVYIKEVYGEVCGPHATRLLYYRNTHPSLTLKIRVDHWWKIDSGEVLHNPPVDHVLPPNPGADPHVVHPKDSYMGCPIPGPTMQQFYWDFKVIEIL
jgi:hypothetical protein